MTRHQTRVIIFAPGKHGAAAEADGEYEEVPLEGGGYKRRRGTVLGFSGRAFVHMRQLSARRTRPQAPRLPRKFVLVGLAALAVRR